MDTDKLIISNSPSRWMHPNLCNFRDLQQTRYFTMSGSDIVGGLVGPSLFFF